MPFTYDATTTAGQVRLLITDTSQEDASFDDTEIAAFLLLGRQNIYEAAALAYETWARSRPKLDLMVKVGTVQTQQEGSEAMLALAAAIRKAKPRASGTVGLVAADGGIAAYFRTGRSWPGYR